MVLKPSMTLTPPPYPMYKVFCDLAPNRFSNLISYRSCPDTLPLGLLAICHLLPVTASLCLCSLWLDSAPLTLYMTSSLLAALKSFLISLPKVGTIYHHLFLFGILFTNLLTITPLDCKLLEVGDLVLFAAGCILGA